MRDRRSAPIPGREDGSYAPSQSELDPPPEHPVARIEKARVQSYIRGTFAHHPRVPAHPELPVPHAHHVGPLVQSPSALTCRRSRPRSPPRTDRSLASLRRYSSMGLPRACTNFVKGAVPRSAATRTMWDQCHEIVGEDHVQIGQILGQESGCAGEEEDGEEEDVSGARAPPDRSDHEPPPERIPEPHHEEHPADVPYDLTGLTRGRGAAVGLTIASSVVVTASPTKPQNIARWANHLTRLQSTIGF